MQQEVLKGHGEKLSTHGERAIDALLTTSSRSEAAKKAGVSESSLQRWLRIPKFRRALEEEQRRRLEAATMPITGLVGKALDRLESQITFGEPPDAIRCAKIVLDQCNKEREFLYKKEQLEKGRNRKADHEEASLAAGDDEDMLETDTNTPTTSAEMNGEEKADGAHRVENPGTKVTPIKKLRSLLPWRRPSKAQAKPVTSTTGGQGCR